MNSDNPSPLDKGIEAARGGNKVLARLHLSQAAESQPQNPKCWAWMAWVAESPSVALQHLERAIEYDPGNRCLKGGILWFKSLLDLPVDDLAPGEEREAGNPEAGDGLPETSPWEDWLGPIPQDSGIASQSDFIDLLGGGDTDSTMSSLDSGVSPSPEAPEPTMLETPELDLPNEQAEPKPPAPPKAEGAFELSKWEMPEPEFDYANSEKLFWAPASAEVGPLLLIVDDSATIRKIVTMAFEKINFEVLTAADGVEAITMIGKRVPDVVLLDINMPRMDGYKVCKVIRGHDATKQIPVIMLSGRDGMFDKVRGRMAGCTDYITKPFEANSVIQKVREYLPNQVGAN